MGTGPRKRRGWPVQRHHLEIGLLLASTLRLCAELVRVRSAGGCTASDAGRPRGPARERAAGGTPASRPKRVASRAERIAAAAGLLSLTLFSILVEPWHTGQRRGGPRHGPHAWRTRDTHVSSRAPLLLTLPSTCPLTAVTPYAVRGAESDGIAQGVLAAPSVLAALVVAHPSGAKQQTARLRL